MLAELIYFLQVLSQDSKFFASSLEFIPVKTKCYSRHSNFFIVWQRTKVTQFVSNQSEIFISDAEQLDSK